MRAKTLLAAALFALVATAGSAAHAQDANRLSMARELMGLMRIENLLSDFFTQMSPMVASAMARELRLTASEEARMGELVAEEFRAATPGLAEEMAQVYAMRMSEQQLHETVAFLRSPSGAAFLQTQFDAQTELERIGGAAGMRVGAQAFTRFNAERATSTP
jgi:hypothetical protein